MVDLPIEDDKWKQLCDEMDAEWADIQAKFPNVVNPEIPEMEEP